MKSYISEIIYSYFQLKKYKISKHELNSTFDNQPFCGSLLHIKQGLNSLGVPNVALEINPKDKTQVLDLPTPFISHLEDIKEFILIDKIEDEKVDYVNESGKKVSEDWNIFEKKMVGYSFTGFS